MSEQHLDLFALAARGLVINGDDGAMPEMDLAELAEWRKYVWEDAPLPLAAPMIEQAAD
jgi:hypothetical protein